MTDITDAEWDAFVDAHPEGNFFHRSAWRHMARNVFGHAPHYLTVRRGGAVAAVLPLVEVRSWLFGHALISNAFCVGGGPLATDDDARAAILEEAERLGRRLKVDYVELRDTAQAAEGWKSRGDLYASFAGPIPGDLKLLPPQRRNQLRRALRKNISVTVERSTDAFYPIYAEAMRDFGTPALPRRFFDKLLTTFGEDCNVVVGRAADRPVTAVMCYYYKGRVMPYYAGCLAEGRALSANMLLYWSLMGLASERGCSMFDFGRSKLGTGPYKFKQEWGFEPRQVVHQYRLIGSDKLPNVNPNNPKYAPLIRAWQRLPVAVATAISPPLSRVLA